MRIVQAVDAVMDPTLPHRHNKAHVVCTDKDTRPSVKNVRAATMSKRKPPAKRAYMRATTSRHLPNPGLRELVV